MSLFQAREWWSIKPDGDEECDAGCLSIANIDNAADKHDKIITGSFEGFLRVYYPRQRGYKIDDLMLEVQLDFPILQIEAGRFLPNSQRLALAILHPNRITIYSVKARGAKDDAKPSYYDLEKEYEHRLTSTAYNFCYGPFGGVIPEVDFLCVQTMDGQLFFFEQDSVAFVRWLNNPLVPGPICYLAKTDSFVTVNAAMDVECYKYQMLGVSSHSKADEVDEHGLTSTKKVQVDWTINLGEHIVDIQLARFSRSLASSNVDILVLGEHTMFTLKENGQIRLQKRLDYNPSCCIAYDVSDPSAGGSNQNLLVGTHQNSFMVYKDTQFIWAARCFSTPVAVRVAAFGGADSKSSKQTKGFVVALDDACNLTITYMGTDPPVHGVQGAVDSKELDYDAMDEEHRHLLKTIRQANSDTIAEPEDKLILRAQVSRDLTHGDTRVFGEGLDEHCIRDEHGNYLSATVLMHLSSNGADELENVHIALEVPSAFIAQQSSLVIPSIGGGNRTPLTIPLHFRAHNTFIPSSLKVKAVASYTTQKGEPRSAVCTFNLPLSLACKVVPPCKNQTFQFTLGANRPPPRLADVFADVLSSVIESSPEINRAAAKNYITLLFHAQNVDVSIVISPKSGRYRLTSGCFEAMALITGELWHHLSSMFGAHNGEGQEDAKSTFRVDLEELLPCKDYFTIIDRHHSIRKRMNELRTSLDNHAHQFRSVEKRLLVRFKSKNPTPLNQLDVLLVDTYEAIKQEAEEMSECQKQLQLAASSLSCATQLMLYLMKFKFDLDEQNFQVLSNHMTPVVSDATEQGWEERVEASLTHLLRTSLAKNVRETAYASQPLVFLEDTTKFKKIISLTCERLKKGLRPCIPRRTREPTRPPKPTLPTPNAEGSA